MTLIDGLEATFLISGAFFFAIGTLGLLRFPDVYTRLHALTKVDNIGLGLIVAGLIIGSDSPALAFKLILIWLLAMAAGATGGHMVAHRAHKLGIPVREKS